MSYRDEFLNSELDALEKELGRIYSGANKAVYKRLRKYVRQYSSYDEMLKEQAENGEIDDSEYKALIRQKVFSGKAWEREKYEMSEVLYNANVKAFNYSNSRLETIYETSRNIGRYETEKHYGRDLGMGLFILSTLTAKQKEKKLPKKTVNKVKDIKHNVNSFQTTIVRYTERAKTLVEVARRAVKYVTEANKRFTGTASQYLFWGISDEGDWESMLDAKAAGIDIQKEWRATLDNHTRDTHRNLDGQVREVEDEFETDGYFIMYPRQPSAAPEMIINCRCRMVKRYPKYDDLVTNRKRVENYRFGGTRKRIDWMTYREWEKWKAGGRRG